MGQVHRFLGLTVGRVSPDIDDFEAKRAAYACDVTYGTNTELRVSDYLRDNMARSATPLVQRGHAFAIVDEVDSILIDRGPDPADHLPAPAPSRPSSTTSLPVWPGPSSPTRIRGRRREADRRPPPRKASPRSSGPWASTTCTTSSPVTYVHQLTQAAAAKELYKRDKDYLVTARRRSNIDEVHRPYLEAVAGPTDCTRPSRPKSACAIAEENHTWATVTLQTISASTRSSAG